MAKRDALRLPGGSSVETGPDWNGRYWIGYRKGASMFFRDVKALRKWLQLPAGIPSRDAFDSWVASVHAMTLNALHVKGSQRKACLMSTWPLGLGLKPMGWTNPILNTKCARSSDE